ncbi:MAG: permease [Austwickia sp.]|nr:permease [Austwickia sp.]
MSVLTRPSSDTARWAGLGAAALAWVTAWQINERLWTALVQWWGLDLHERLVGAVHFFAYDTVKIFLLLIGLMFAVGMLRASLDLDRARAYLEGRGLFAGLFLAVVLGVVTPFCSCSSIPLFMGFVAAGIPLSVTLTFLIASPLVSEIAAIMIGDQFGWGIAGAYVLAGGTLSMVIGWVFSRFDLTRWVDDMVFATRVAALRADGHVPTLQERIEAAVAETREIFASVWKWVVVGVGIGAAIHGWVPTDFFARYAGPDNPFAVVVATLAGVPLYVNGAGVVPIAEALWAKGVSLGTVMAFTMSSIALSIPQAIMLRRVLKPPLLAIFFGAVAVGIIAIGFLFNLVAP